MIVGVAVRGGVAAGVALIVACAVALVEEQALEVEAESLERRLESRLDALDSRLGRISEQLQAFVHLRGGQRCEHDHRRQALWSLLTKTMPPRGWAEQVHTGFGERPFGERCGEPVHPVSSPNSGLRSMPVPGTFGHTGWGTIRM